MDEIKEWWNSLTDKVKGIIIVSGILLIGIGYWLSLPDTNIEKEDAAPFTGKKWVGSWSDDIGGGVQKTYIFEIFPSKKEEGRYEYQLDINKYAPPSAYGAGFNEYITHRGMMAEELEEYCHEIKYYDYCSYIWRCEGSGKEVALVSKYDGSLNGEKSDPDGETAGKFCEKDDFRGEFRLFNPKGESYRVISVEGMSYKDCFKYRGADGEKEYQFVDANGKIDRTEVWLDGELLSCEGSCK